MSEIKPCPLCVSAPKDDPYDVARRLLARLAYAGGCRLETHRDIIELDPALSKVKASVAIDAMTTFASDACASVQKERDDLREMLELLRKANKIETVSNGQWALHLEFGIGEANCGRMRKFSDDLRAFLARYEALK